jgi:Xaa-Pro dipeptidase
MAHADATFPLQEFQARIRKTRLKMAEMKADVLLIDCVEHMVYLFGYAPPAAIYQAVLLPLDGEPVGIVRTLDASMFSEQSWVRDVVHFADHEDPVSILAAEVKRHGWGRACFAIELDSHFLPAKRFMQLQAALPGVRFVDFSQILWEMRLI